MRFYFSWNWNRNPYLHVLKIFLGVFYTILYSINQRISYCLTCFTNLQIASKYFHLMFGFFPWFINNSISGLIQWHLHWGTTMYLRFISELKGQFGKLNSCFFGDWLMLICGGKHWVNTFVNFYHFYKSFKSLHFGRHLLSPTKSSQETLLCNNSASASHLSALWQCSLLEGSRVILLRS